MDTNRLKSFAQKTRTELMGQVSRKLDAVLAPDSAERREAPAAIRTLERRIAQSGKAMVIEQVAYTWFNRFTALRYMDVNGYLTPMVVSQAPDRTRPELLDQAAAGAIPDHVRTAAATRVRDLLEGRAPSREPQLEAYRLLLVATCNHLSALMSFMFEAIADYTELLMPDALLAPDGWVAQLREVMTEDSCQDVEIIGWLYQFYISEKKDQVFAGLKKNQKITAENIPAATQLFTPHWIVRYLVENSLGRLWLLNRPGSRLAERMDYYIAPEEPETDFLRIGRPEEIKVCDPACGSGHMLTYAFDLLYAIYEEEGYDPAQIPGLILTHNLTGVEIDDRAGALAAFALAMKAAAKLGRRRFLRMEARPDIVVLENVTFTPAEMTDVAAVVGRDLFTDELRETLMQFEQAKNFGSLIVPKLRDPAETLRVVEARDFGGDLLLKEVQDRVVAVLRMAEALSPKYHVVVANPPYAGAKGLNAALGSWIRTQFPRSKADLMTCFMERASDLVVRGGTWGMINLPSWMFLSSFEQLRHNILENQRFASLLHLGRGIFGADFGSVAFVVEKRKAHPSKNATYRRLFDKHVLVRSPEEIERLFLGASHGSFRASQADLLNIPGAPIAYWLSPRMFEIFDEATPLIDGAEPRQGLATADDERFLRLWHEASRMDLSISSSDGRWHPFSKGGEFRKWYGNHIHVVNWKGDGAELKAFERSVIRNEDYYGRPGLSWTLISSGKSAFRDTPSGFVFGHKGPAVFPRNEAKYPLYRALLGSKLCEVLLEILSPAIGFEIGHISKIPVLDEGLEQQDFSAANANVSLARSDWDAYEISWDFTTLPLLSPDHRGETLEATCTRLRAHWQGMTDEMQRLEEENNRIFIDAYGLQDELTPEVPLEEITLTCNPAYRYGVKGTEAEREARLRADTMKELISYAIGCMFGRYSLDAPGLILASQGETLQDYLARIPAPTFRPDRDNVIPLIEEDRFEDDAYQRFREFLAVTFGEERLVENLEFMRGALGKEVRAWLARDFYADHVQRYKKRPIYWLISSPRGAFQALIYMHRYTPDTLNIALNDYVRSLRDKLEASRRAAEALRISPEASAAERNRAGREIEKLASQIAEITEWERDVLYPLAVQRKRIDLDDGVKRNYPEFAGVVKPIKGLEQEDA